VVAAPDPNAKISGHGATVLRKLGLEIQEGCLRDWAEKLNLPFATWVQKRRPLLTAKMALSLDGRIGLKGQRLVLSGKACEPTTMRLRAEAGAILIGVGTLLADDPQLNVRGRWQDRHPIRAIVDPQLRTPPQSRIFSVPGGPVWIFCRKEMVVQGQALKKAGAKLIPLSLNQEGVFSPAQILQAFFDQEITAVLLEGGPKLLTHFAAAGLLDRWVLYLTPRILGPVFEGVPTLPLLEKGHFPLEFRSVIRRGDDWAIGANPV